MLRCPELLRGFCRGLAGFGLGFALLCCPHVAAAPDGVDGQESATTDPVADAPIGILGIRLDPATPGPDTLCQLWVTVANRQARPASLLEFSVSIEGQPVTTYADDTFVVRLSANSESEIRLFNFWTTEDGRPASKDGSLTVDVELTGASWMSIEGPSENEIWTPLEPVVGLPSKWTFRSQAAKASQPR